MLAQSNLMSVHYRCQHTWQGPHTPPLASSQVEGICSLLLNTPASISHRALPSAHPRRIHHAQEEGRVGQGQDAGEAEAKGAGAAHAGVCILLLEVLVEVVMEVVMLELQTARTAISQLRCSCCYCYCC